MTGDPGPDPVPDRRPEDDPDVASSTGSDPEHPPSREGLTDAEVWEWTGEQWQVRRIGAFEEANPGGSPAPVDDP